MFMIYAVLVGLVAGLLLGARLAGLGSRIVGVRIIEEDVANRPKIARMVNRAARYLHRRDPSVPRITIEAEEVDLLDGYLGEGYAHPTPEAQDAVHDAFLTAWRRWSDSPSACCCPA
mgnify:CR=1 FL=1